MCKVRNSESDITTECADPGQVIRHDSVVTQLCFSATCYLRVTTVHNTLLFYCSLKPNMTPDLDLITVQILTKADNAARALPPFITLL